MLSLVVPTYNERKSLADLLPRLEEVAKTLDCPLEVVVVDDNSPDGTAEFAQSYRADAPMFVRVVPREGKFGLASAIIEGWRSCRGEILAVMEADGSHDESLLSEMYRRIQSGKVEVCVGSRYVQGGDLGDWGLKRRVLSRIAVSLGRGVCPVQDSTSGFLMFHRDVLEGVSLDPEGFRIGLEVLVRGRYRIYDELPYVFVSRRVERSTPGIREVMRYLVQLGRLYVYRYRHPAQRRRWQKAVS